MRRESVRDVMRWDDVLFSTRQKKMGMKFPLIKNENKGKRNCHGRRHKIEYKRQIVYLLFSLTNKLTN